MAFVPLNTNNSDLANYNNVNNALRDLNNKKIKNADLSTTPGDLGGEWKDWTPTWVSLTVGNGTVFAKYTQVGKTVKAKLKLTFGTTTSISANYPTFSLPVTAITQSTGFAGICHLIYLDTGVNWYYGTRLVNSGATNVALVVSTANATYVTEGAYSATAPVTWGNTDTINAYLEYEVA